MRVPLSVLAAVLAGACSKPVAPTPDAGAADTVDSPVMLRESSRELLEVNCGECHTRGLPTALPRALAVYDLTESDWSANMTDAQLWEAARRLREPFGPTLGETEIHAIRATDVELARFDRFVAMETARRAVRQ